MKVLVCGSRDWQDEDRILDEITEAGATEIITGDCRGADKLALKCAARLGLPAKMFPALWGRHGKAAGPSRNQEMVDEKPDVCLAFVLPGSRGTWDTVNRCKRAGIPVKVVNKK